MKGKLKILTIGFTGTIIFSSCSSIDIAKTAYNTYSTYKDTKNAVKGYQNIKNIASIIRVKPIFYHYKSVKVEVVLKDVKGRNNEKLAEALKENIKYDLSKFFKEYGLNKSICETNCERTFITVRFKERSYKSVLQKWALKGKYGGKIQYIDGETGDVLLEDEIGNKETFYDIARTIGEILEIKIYRTGLQRYISEKDKVREYQNKYGKNLQKRKPEKYVNRTYEEILKNT